MIKDYPSPILSILRNCLIQDTLHSRHANDIKNSNKNYFLKEGVSLGSKTKLNLGKLFYQ